jgi:hypothetical protein
MPAISGASKSSNSKTKTEMSNTKQLVTAPKTEWRLMRTIAGSDEEAQLQKSGWEPFAGWPRVPSDPLGSLIVLYRAKINV